MNRVGLMVDVSHPFKGSMMRAAALSKAPIIASHSAARALCNVSGIWTMERQALAKTGGVIQIVGVSERISKTPKPDDARAEPRSSRNFETLSSAVGRVQRGAAPDFAAALRQLSPDRRAEYDRRMASIDALPARQRPSSISSTTSTTCSG